MSADDIYGGFLVNGRGFLEFNKGQGFKAQFGAEGRAGEDSEALEDVEGNGFTAISNGAGEAVEVVGGNGAGEDSNTSPQSSGIVSGALPLSPIVQPTSVEPIVEDPEDEDIPIRDKARICADRLLSSIIRPDSKDRRRWLFGKMDPEVLTDENYILYRIMHSLRSENFTINSDFLRIHFQVYLSEINKAAGKIDLTSHGDVEGSNEAAYAEGVISHFEYLLTLPELTDDEFFRDFNMYMLYFQQIEGTRILREAYTILEDGKKEGSGRGLKAGFSDAADFTRRSLAAVEGLLHQDEGDGFISLKDSILNEERNKVTKVSDYDKIDELNNHFGGISSGEVITVLAGPKTGKTKFVTRIAHTTAVKYGNNVTFWPIEGGYKMAEAQLRAIHFNHMYNEGRTIRERHQGVDQSHILLNRLNELGPEFASMEEISKHDLINNPEYGRIEFISRDLNLETFIDEIDTSVTSNNSSLLVIDYLQLIHSIKSTASKHEVISRAYQELLSYCKKKNLACILPAQYNQNSLRELDKGNLSDLRTSGGESSEVIRSVDTVISMYASTEDIRSGRVTFLSIPARFSVPFETFTCFADLGTCDFISINND